MAGEYTWLREQLYRVGVAVDEELHLAAYAALCRYGRVEAALDWDAIGHLPIALDAEWRVRLDCATPDDFDQAADHYQRRGQHPDGVTGLRFLARAARDAGVTYVRELDR